MTKEEEINNTELTAEESEAVIKTALFEAKRIKLAKQKETEYWDKVRKPLEFPQYTAEQLFEIIKKQFEEAKWNLDIFNEQIVHDLCKYFTGDPTGPYNLEKGILLRGGVGCGKTSIMRLFQYNQISSYRIISCRLVAAAYAESGHTILRNHSGLLKTPDVRLTWGQTEIGSCFDDLGTEEEKKNFGNQVNVMGELILNRYDAKEVLRAKTHITTNLSIDEIEKYYGTRVRSRLKEMFNDVVFKNDSPDRRK